MWSSCFHMSLLQVVSILIKLKVSIKNEDSRLNHLPKSNSCIKPQALHMIAYKGYSSGNPTSTRGTTSSGSHWSSHGKFHVVSALLWSLMTKGERNEQRYESILGWQRGRWDESAIMDMDQEEHTSRGSKLMNFVARIWYVHIHVLACICISFKIYICIACVWCMLVIELDWWFDN